MSETPLEPYEDQEDADLDPQDALELAPDPETDGEHEPNPDAGDYS